MTTLDLCNPICEKQLRDCREQKSEQLQHRASPLTGSSECYGLA